MIRKRNDQQPDKVRRERERVAMKEDARRKAERELAEALRAVPEMN